MHPGIEVRNLKFGAKIERDIPDAAVVVVVVVAVVAAAVCLV